MISSYIGQVSSQIASIARKEKIKFSDPNLEFIVYCTISEKSISESALTLERAIEIAEKYHNIAFANNKQSDFHVFLSVGLHYRGGPKDGLITGHNQWFEISSFMLQNFQKVS